MSANKQPLTICFVAGKSGGHIIPCLTLAHQWHDKYPSGQILFISSNSMLDKKLTNSSEITYNYYLKLGNIPRKDFIAYPKFLYQLIHSFFSSIRILKKHRPNYVISTGGIIALPVIFAAQLLRIPVELWELNAVPGKAIFFLARYARKIHVCFPQAQQFFKKNTCVISRYPVRYHVSDKISQTGALSKIVLSTSRFTLFIIGGSQGAASLSTLIQKFVSQHAEFAHKLQCIHQTGSDDQTDWQSWYQEHIIPAIVFGYQHDIATYFCAADLVLSRAGAGGIFEIDFFNKPCILVPLNSGQTRHQLDNAHAYAQTHPNTCFTGTNDQEIIRELVTQIKAKN